MILSCYKVEQEGGWSRPDGMREASRGLRIRQIDVKSPDHAAPPAGGSGFNRFPNSAGPGLFMQWCEDAMV